MHWLSLLLEKEEEIKVIEAGDVCAVVGLKDAMTGDTLADEKSPIVLESISPKRPSFIFDKFFNIFPSYIKESRLLFWELYFSYISFAVSSMLLKAYSQPFKEAFLNAITLLIFFLISSSFVNKKSLYKSKP